MNDRHVWSDTYDRKWSDFLSILDEITLAVVKSVASEVGHPYPEVPTIQSTDNVEAFSSYQTDRKKLLETGVRIFEFRPDAAERKKIMTGELQLTLDHKPIFGLHF